MLSGHDHGFEVFAAQTPTGTADPSQGMTQIVVRTGGKSHYAYPTSAAPNSLVRHHGTFGVLKATLGSGRAGIEFLPEAGRTFTYSSTLACH